ncbi:MAG: hypothetical protein H7A23_26455 [Leptospiraceae bacterium]|nr:hypothetical protein [Leptospiraceae bacterium]
MLYIPVTINKIQDKMGKVLITIGIVIWYAWASDINRGKRDSRYVRMIHIHPIGGCLPFVIAFALIGFGIYLLIRA